MLIDLYPFPSFLHPPFGESFTSLPVTRDGVRLVPEGQLVATRVPFFAELNVMGGTDDLRSRGICGLLPAAVFLDGTVKPHEKTLLSRLQRQEANVMADNGALGKPVLLTVPSLKNWWKSIDTNQSQPLTHVEFRGQNNRYQMSAFSEARGVASGPLALEVEGPLVIADGHHRAETHARLSASGVSSCDFIPVCIIGGDELKIGAFTREISERTSIEDLLLRLSEFFTYELLDGKLPPRTEGKWLLVRNDAYYRLTRKASADKSLDVAWLDQTVLPAVFGITDTRADERITFSPTPEPKDGYLDFDLRPDITYLCGFPLPMDSFFAEVSAGRCLPPKSTRFEPRVPSGLVVWQP